MLHVVEVEEAEAEAEAEKEKEEEAEAEAIARGGGLATQGRTMLVFSRYLKIFETGSNFRTLVLRNRSYKN